jgi:nucleoside-diphosphate-sugar epimerase
MKIVVIGGTGHVGTYMVPRLVEANHQVTVVSRGQREAYMQNPAWVKVEKVVTDRENEESASTFGKKILDLKPDVVIDMICFSPESSRHLVEALKGKVSHMLFCGTIWIHGHSVTVPTMENQGLNPFGEYGVQKAAMTEYLLKEARVNHLPITVIHPGHIVGQGWNPLNPLGNFNPRVFTALARGNTVHIPTLGLETVHHVHADDVARLFVESISNWNAVLGEDFHIVSEAAVTLRGYAETVASWFNKKPDLKFSAGEEWKEGFSEKDIEFTWEHIRHSPNCSMEKVKKYLGFKPRYTSFEAVYESLMWLIDNNIVKP